MTQVSSSLCSHQRRVVILSWKGFLGARCSLREDSAVGYAVAERGIRLVTHLANELGKRMFFLLNLTDISCSQDTCMVLG